MVRITGYIEKDPERGLYVAIVPGIPGAHTLQRFSTFSGRKRKGCERRPQPIDSDDLARRCRSRISFSVAARERLLVGNGR
jgi:hypothetical protein